MIEKVSLKTFNFENEAEQSAAISDLKNLMEHPGWRFLKRVIKMNVKFLRKELETNEDLSKEDNNIIKRDMRFLKSLLKLPDFQIDVLSGKDVALEDDDPYYQDVETLEEEEGAKIVEVSAPPKEKNES